MTAESTPTQPRKRRGRTIDDFEVVIIHEPDEEAQLKALERVWAIKLPEETKS